MDEFPFLDTNILIRFVAQDHEEHLLRAVAFFQSIERGETRVRISDTVVFETVYVLQRPYGWERSSIRDAVLPVIELDGVILPGKAIFADVFALYVTHRGLSFADCYHAVLARHLGCTEIITFDRGFDRIPGLTRREP
jgi:predicted nucleic acid-binding protein